MCGGGSAPDTSGQEAEAKRQRDADAARAKEERDAQQAEYDRRYAAEQKRAEDAAAQQRADAERYAQQLQDIENKRLADQQTQAASQKKATDDENARREAERVATLKQQQDAADQTRAEATARQSRIDSSVANVTNAFAGFNDDYYNKFANDYTAYYQPQIQKQYDEAVRKSTLDLADRGTLDSTAAARVYGRLADQFTTQSDQVASDARNNANSFRGSVEGQKNSLLQAATNGSEIGDPSLVSSSIRAPSFTPLGQLFANLVPAAQAAAKPSMGVSSSQPGLFSSSVGPSGSYRVVA